MNFVAIAIVTPVVWVLRSLVQDIKAVQHDLAQHKTHVAETYVEKDDLHRELEDIKRMVGRLLDKMDKIGKA